MTNASLAAAPLSHSQYSSAREEKNGRRTWALTTLCGAMMIAEIIGGLLFQLYRCGGLHMSIARRRATIRCARLSLCARHAGDRRFTFGTGKLGLAVGNISSPPWPVSSTALITAVSRALRQESPRCSADPKVDPLHLWVPRNLARGP